MAFNKIKFNMQVALYSVGGFVLLVAIIIYWLFKRNDDDHGNPTGITLNFD